MRRGLETACMIGTACGDLAAAARERREMTIYNDHEEDNRYFIIHSDESAIGIIDTEGNVVISFTEHTIKEIGEGICRFLNGRLHSAYILLADWNAKLRQKSIDRCKELAALRAQVARLEQERAQLREACNEALKWIPPVLRAVDRLRTALAATEPQEQER